jgi:uncharacterized protein (UPF0371 family)
MTELHLNNGTVVLFSYETPVAAALYEEQLDSKGNKYAVHRYIKTSKKWSPTTSRHISKWISENYRFMPRYNKEVDQSVLDELVK